MHRSEINSLIFGCSLKINRIPITEQAYKIIFSGTCFVDAARVTDSAHPFQGSGKIPTGYYRDYLAESETKEFHLSRNSRQ